LLAGDRAKLATELKNRVLEGGGLLNVGTLLGGDAGSAGLILDGDLKVDHLVGKGADAVVEAEAVLTSLIGCEDKVALTFLGTVEDGSFSTRL
jgi:hypothetical protein